MTGLPSSFDTPYNDVDWDKKNNLFCNFGHKEIISPSTVYCPQNLSQMTNSCCSPALSCMHWLFLALFG